MSGIYKKIMVIMGSVPAIGKDGKINAGSFNYAIRKADDVFNKVLPLLNVHGVVMTKKIVATSQQMVSKVVKDVKKDQILVSITCEFTFTDIDDGSSVVTCSIGCGIDDSDKAYTKAQTVAMRIAFTEVFAIPFSESEWRSGNDSDDSDQQSEQIGKPAKPRSKANELTNEIESVKAICRGMFGHLGTAATDAIAKECQGDHKKVNYDSWTLNTWQLFKDKLSNAIHKSLTET